MARKTKKAVKKTPIKKKAAVKKSALRRFAPKKAAAKRAAPKKAAKKAAHPDRSVTRSGLKVDNFRGAPMAEADSTPPQTPAVTRGGLRGGNFRGEAAMAEAERMVVIITATFTGVAAGNSKIKATFNGEESTRTSSGNITFSGLKQDDLIRIDGTSPGNTKVEINVSATPPEMNFPPGNFNHNFVIN